MPTESAFDIAVSALLLAILAALWFAWSTRHTRGLWALLPVAGAFSAVVIMPNAFMAALTGQAEGGSSVEPAAIGVYLIALVLQAVVTRWIAGFLASHDQARLVPTVVAVSTLIHVVVLAELLSVSNLYFVALFGLAAVVLAWPIASLGRLMSPKGTPMTHPTTGVLMGAILLAGAAHALI